MSSPEVLPMQPVVGGRFVQRRTADGTIVIGVLHLPAHVRPDPLGSQEAWTCRVDEIGAQPHLLIGAHPISTSPVQWEPDDGDLLAMVRMPAWRTYGHAPATTFDIRMVRAFPGTNSWTFVGVTPHQVIDATDRTHQWVDIQGTGAMVPIQPPTSIPLEGMALSQVLRDLCVWPDCRGRLHTLPVSTPSLARERSLVGVLHALLAQGHLTAQGRHVLELNWPGLAPLLDRHEAARDKGFRSFVAQLADLGLLQPERAYTQEELQARELGAGAVASQLLAQQRYEEMQELAVTVDLDRNDSDAPRPRG